MPPRKNSPYPHGCSTPGEFLRTLSVAVASSYLNLSDRHAGDTQGIRDDGERRADAKRGRKKTPIDDKHVGLLEHAAIRICHRVLGGVAKAKRPALVGDMFVRGEWLG